VRINVDQPDLLGELDKPCEEGVVGRGEECRGNNEATNPGVDQYEEDGLAVDESRLTA